MRGYQSLGGAILICFVKGATCVVAAELAVQELALVGGTTADVIVNGTIAGEETFGVTILVEILPRAGAKGTVFFTPSPPVDIYQAGDPWSGAGGFTPFDTDSQAFCDTLNGSVDEDGRWLCDRGVSFTGPLAGFPVVASADAVGVWDVVLSTSVGDSRWECLATTHVDGTITVTPGPDIPTLSGWGVFAMALLLLGLGTVVIARRQQPQVG